MWKKVCIALLALMFLLSGCGETGPDSPNDPDSPENAGETGDIEARPFQPIYLSRQEHPELDFGISEKDGGMVIRDYTVGEDGSLMLLELSGNVYRYSPQGELLRVYDFQFEEKGLTAYRFVCDGRNRFYFLDGHNNAIIRGEENGDTHVSSLGKETGIADVGLIQNLSVAGENLLSITAVSPEYRPYTYTIDVSGSQAVCTEEPVEGAVRGDGLRYKNELITGDGGALTDGTVLTLYESDTQEKRMEIHTTHAAIVGVTLYGRVSEKGYLIKIFEFLEDGTLQETAVLLSDSGEVYTCNMEFQSSDVIRMCRGDTLILRYEEDGISVFSLFDLCEDYEKNDWLSVEIQQIK